MKATALGLKSLKQFLRSLPNDPELALIIIDHLKAEADIRQIILSCTSMPVKELSISSQIERNKLYILPEDSLLLNETVSAPGSFGSGGIEKEEHSSEPFFHSLARAGGNHAVCICFAEHPVDKKSLNHFRKYGGFVIAETQDSKNDISIDEAVDMKLPACEIGKKLVEYRQRLENLRVPDTGLLTEQESNIVNRVVEQVMLQTRKYLDMHKPRTIRQIKRRMLVNGIPSLGEYLTFVKNDNQELGFLTYDLMNMISGCIGNDSSNIQHSFNYGNITPQAESPEEPAGIASIMVDNDKTLQYYTPKAADIFKFLSTEDETHWIEKSSDKLDYNSIPEDIEQVLKTSEYIKKTVSSKDGKQFIMKISPYLNRQTNREGVLLNFKEIDQHSPQDRRTHNPPDHGESLVKIGHYALQEQSVKSITEQILDQICSTLLVDEAAVLTTDPGSESHTILGCSSSIREQFDQDTSIIIQDGWDAGKACNTDNNLHIRYYDGESIEAVGPLQNSNDIATGLFHCISGTNQEYGVLCLFSRNKRSFEDFEIQFIRIVANILGSLLERERSKRELKAANKQLEEEIERSKFYQKEILNINIVERWNLGDYLHDNLGQTLVSAKIMLDDINRKLRKSKLDLSDEITEVVNIIETGLQGIRNLSHEIVPIDIESEGVIHAFKRMLKQAEKLHQVNCTLETDEITDVINNRELITNLYRVAQEAVNNAILHCGADRIKVSISGHNNRLFMRIYDDGKYQKYPSEDPEDTSIYLMKYRMELLGGSFAMSQPQDSDSYTNLITCTLPKKALESRSNF